MKKITLLILILSLLNCKKDEVLLSDSPVNYNLQNTIQQKKYLENDLIASTTLENGYGTVKNEILKKYEIDAISVDINKKELKIQKNDGSIYFFKLEKSNEILDGKEKYIVSLPSENIKNNRVKRGLKERLACYAMFGIIVVSDGPSPIMDIIGAIALAECLKEADKYPYIENIDINENQNLSL